ncbi:MAG: hypothetical protein MUE52_01850 [Tabrizicola sp.]|jgi:hypothetical protein|nr:hypothetical protein [Tabrizicola sp.]
MIRCSKLAAVLALMPAIGPAVADPLVSDAFGLFDPSRTAPERHAWAGWRETGRPVAPDAPDVLVIFAGPKSMVAGKDPGHVVGIVLDRFGNLVADGTPALATVAGTPTPIVTRGGIAELLVSPQTLAGELPVGLGAGARQSPKAILGVTADIASIQPRIEGPLPLAQAEAEFTFHTEPMTDRFGNPAPDGTALTSILRHANGSFSLAQTSALQNRALARFIARDIPGAATAVLTLGNRTSADLPLVIAAPRAVGFPVLEAIDLPRIAAVRLTVGPFLTSDGYALADGAQVVVEAGLPHGETVRETAWVVDGEATLLLPFPARTPVVRLSVISPLGPMDLTQAWTAAVAATSGGAEP